MDQAVTTIYIFKTDYTPERILNPLKRYFAQQEVEVIELAQATSLLDVNYLLLIEPYRNFKEDYSISSIWNSWLLHNSPYAHLLVASFSSSRHSNFLNLANLPDDLSSWLNTTQPAVKFIPEMLMDENENGEKIERIVDPWKRKIPLTGQDLKSKFRLFIRGHDDRNSFKMALIRITTPLQNMQILYENESNDSEKELLLYRKKAKKEWDKLLNRWNQYNHLLPLLPLTYAFHAAEIPTEEMLRSRIKELESIMKKKLPSRVEVNQALDIVAGLSNLVQQQLAKYIEK